MFMNSIHRFLNVIIQLKDTLLMNFLVMSIESTEIIQYTHVLWKGNDQNK